MVNPMSKKKISQFELDHAFHDCVYFACQNLAAASFERIMKDPLNGLQYLSKWASVLDMKIEAKFEMNLPSDQEGK